MNLRTRDGRVQKFKQFVNVINGGAPPPRQISVRSRDTNGLSCLEKKL